ncbi:MAG: methyltransferase domain-containing protein [Chloroflexi bacterium]|nr:methyltransferase domain-containing protein [Chloroflexota bacterium]
MREEARQETAATDPLRLTEAAALVAWQERVRRNQEQVARVREVEDAPDRYNAIASAFRADPRREDDATLNVLRSLARLDETWLDIGAGGGRYALPLALCTRSVIAVDPSPAMLSVLREAAERHGVGHLEIRQERWPAAVSADVALIAHLAYDVAEIGPFLDAMDSAAHRLCVAVLFYRQPTWALDRLWPEVHGERRATLPALPEFLTLQLARQRPFEVRLVDQRPPTFESVQQALTFARLQTWVQPGGAKDRRLQDLVSRSVTERDGRYAFHWDPLPLGIVTWGPEPRA